MSQHKDLPPNSQAWAKEVDALMEENKQLKEVVRRLCENAGLDFSNPKRGLNAGTAMPSTNNPVGQKLSSLADVQIYNVADKQVLSWAQKDQKWLPVTLPVATAGGTVDISEVAYATGLEQGYGYVNSGTDYAYTTAAKTTYGGVVEIWASDYIYIGQMHSDFGTGGIIQLSQGSYDPWVSLMSYSANGSTELLVVDNDVSVSGGTFTIRVVGTSNRPSMRAGFNRGASVFDGDLGIPIWWNGTTWTNALGTAV